jgi:phage gp36-like protein
MAYCTQADISPARIPLKSLAQLTSDDNSGVVNADVVTAAIAAASGLIENWCRERYKLPLQQTAELTEMAVDIAIFKLYNRRPGKMTETVRAAFDDAVKLLMAIAAKKASLDQPATGAIEQTPAATLLTRRRERVFSGKNLRGFV